MKALEFVIGGFPALIRTDRSPDIVTVVCRTSSEYFKPVCCGVRYTPDNVQPRMGRFRRRLLVVKVCLVQFLVTPGHVMLSLFASSTKKALGWFRVPWDVCEGGIASSKSLALGDNVI